LILNIYITKWLSLRFIKTTLISRDIKLNTEEEERVKLITMPEKDLPCKIKINTTPTNTDWFLELPQEKLSLKLFILHLLVTEFYVKLTQQNSEDSDLKLDSLTIHLLMLLDYY
jgi:hypothetical protein